MHEAVLVHILAKETHGKTPEPGKMDNHNALHNEQYIDSDSVIREGKLFFAFYIVDGVVQWALVAIGVKSSNSCQDDCNYS